MFFRLLWIFFLYSFAGWVIETTLAIIKQKRFVNRGVLNGPLCTIYGVVAIIITLTQRELLNNIPFLIIRAISDKADDSASMDYPAFEKMAIANSVTLILEMAGNL